MDDYRLYLGDEMPKLAREFFATFSRFEFALKRGGFAAGAVGGPASPDWNRFSNLLGQPFLDKMRQAPEAVVYFTEPPRKLMVVALDEVNFVDQPAIGGVQQLFEALRLARNNLFHGDKPYIGGRDETLLKQTAQALPSARAAQAR
jgi:hypothetical protein